MIVLIPAFEPDHRLVGLVGRLMAGDDAVVVVDDGSGPGYDDVFAAAESLGAAVLRFPVNQGKGAALKAGFRYLLREHPGESVVCADADGQHSCADIRKVADAVDGVAELVLGVRRFTGRVPVRSRIGNDMTRRLFVALTGTSIADTQTGLRAYPANVLPWLVEVPGERFEYELQVLLAATRQQRSIRQVDIATIYEDANASSHFRPIRDSIRIYAQLLAFVASSMVGFVIDVATLALLLRLTGSVAVAVVGARLVSGSVNYTVNRRVVFGRDGTAPTRRSLPRYMALAAGLLAANLLLMESLVAVTGSVVVAKVATEASLFVVSFLVQRTLVFQIPAVRSLARAPAEVARRG